MAIQLPFRLLRPEYTEEQIIQALCSGEEDQVRAMTNWLYEQFFQEWKKIIRRTWDDNLAWEAFYETIPIFVRYVKRGNYKEPYNWKGLCRRIAEKKYWKWYNLPPKTQSLVNTDLPEPIQWEDVDPLQELLPLFSEIEWDTYPIHTIADWHSQGYSWQEVSEKLRTLYNVDVDAATLRKQWERAKFQVQVLLIGRGWPRLKDTFSFCHSFCKTFVALRLDGIRADKIKREHPEMAKAIIEQIGKADFSKAAEEQFATCIDCLIKKVAR